MPGIVAAYEHVFYLLHIVCPASLAVPEKHMQPEQQRLRMQCTKGRVNAIAFWFELQLRQDEEQRGYGQAACSSLEADVSPPAAMTGSSQGSNLAPNLLNTGPFSNDSGGQTWKVGVHGV